MKIPSKKCNFCEEAREYHVVACGSLLGMALHEGTGYPVGQTDQIKMYPMSFEEFLMAAGRETLLQQMRAHDWTELSGMRTLLIQAAGVETLYYHSADRTPLEIDFALQNGGVYAVEVKAEENLRSKSLRTVLDRNEDLTGWRFSMSDYREQGKMINIPLYLVEEWMRSQLQIRRDASEAYNMLFQ